MTLGEMQLLIDAGDSLMPKGWDLAGCLQEVEHRERAEVSTNKSGLSPHERKVRSYEDMSD